MKLLRSNSRFRSLIILSGAVHTGCYDLKSLKWDSKTTLVLSNTRELDRVPSIE